MKRMMVNPFFPDHDPTPRSRSVFFRIAILIRSRSRLGSAIRIDDPQHYYEIRYIKGANNYLADFMSRAVVSEGPKEAKFHHI